MSEVVRLEGRQVREIAIDCDGETFLSSGRTRKGNPATVLTQALVSMPVLPLCAPERAIVLSSDASARMVAARAAQGETPIRARAVFDGICWEVLSILSDVATNPVKSHNGVVP